ncbi:hypothetical protein BDFB_014748, partial [Asbolus verrucosus]
MAPHCNPILNARQCRSCTNLHNGKLDKFSSFIKRFSIRYRNDADTILEKITDDIKCCWGSSRRRSVRSNILCNLLRRYKKLKKIHVESTTVTESCKFFKILGQRRKNRKFLEWSYVDLVTI